MPSNAPRVRAVTDERKQFVLAASPVVGAASTLRPRSELCNLIVRWVLRPQTWAASLCIGAWAYMDLHRETV